MDDNSDQTDSKEKNLEAPVSETSDTTEASQSDEGVKTTSDNDTDSETESSDSLMSENSSENAPSNIEDQETEVGESEAEAESSTEDSDDKVDMIIDTLEDETPEISPVEPQDMQPKRSRVFRTFATLSLITALVGGGVGGMKLQQMLDARNATSGQTGDDAQLAALQNENAALKAQIMEMQAPADPSPDLPTLEASDEGSEAETDSIETTAEADAPHTNEDEAPPETQLENSDEASSQNEGLETEILETGALETEVLAENEAIMMDVTDLPSFPQKTVRDVLYAQSISHLTGWQRRLAENVRVRSTAKKDTVDNILDAIANEDMATALSLTESLPAPARVAAQDWASAVQATLTTDVSQESPQ